MGVVKPKTQTGEYNWPVRELEKFPHTPNCCCFSNFREVLGAIIYSKESRRTEYVRTVSI